MLSIKSECLNRLVILGERHLRRAIAQYVEHYHRERTHQGLGNRLIEGVPERELGRVVRRERLGGLLNHYYREAARSLDRVMEHDAIFKLLTHHDFGLG